MNYVDNPFKSPTVLSLCPGMLGLERGLERAIETLWGHSGIESKQEDGKTRGNYSVTVAAYVEIEAFIIWNLVNQMEKGFLAPAPVWADLKTFPAKQFHKKIHGVTGGYPCQPFSVAGNRGGVSDPRHLWPYISKHIRAIRPVWCWFENVPGHLDLGYETVRGELQEMGYSVKEGIYSAEEAGAPMQRKRLYILAVLANSGLSDDAGRVGSEKGQQSTAGRKSRSKPSSQSIRSGSLAISDGQGLQGTICSELQSLQQEKGEYQGSESVRIHSKETGGAVANPNIWRTQLWNDAGMGWVKQQDPWPCRPGEKQYEWEHKRTIEPGVGTSVNGYDFREDLLRMAGNGVVEQTAEIAFIDLLRKHGII